MWDRYVFLKRRQPTTNLYRIISQWAANTLRRKCEILYNKGEIVPFLSTCHPLKKALEDPPEFFHIISFYNFPNCLLTNLSPPKFSTFSISPLTAVASPDRHILQYFHHYKEKCSSLCNIFTVLLDRLHSFVGWRTYTLVQIYEGGSKNNRNYFFKWSIRFYTITTLVSFKVFSF